LPAGLSEWAVHPALGNEESQAIDPGGWRVRHTDYEFLTSPQAHELLQQERITVIDYSRSSRPGPTDRGPEGVGNVLEYLVHRLVMPFSSASRRVPTTGASCRRSPERSSQSTRFRSGVLSYQPSVSTPASRRPAQQDVPSTRRCR
jgi:hypothetical protein